MPTDITQPDAFQLNALCRFDERIHGARPGSARIISIERPVNDDGDPSSFMPRDAFQTGTWEVHVEYTLPYVHAFFGRSTFRSCYGWTAGRFGLWAD